MKKVLQVSLLFVCTLLSAVTIANHTKNMGMTKEEVVQIILVSTDLSYDEAQIITDKLAAAYEKQPGEKIPVSGVLTTRGLNGAFFVDTDDWVMNATLKDPVSGKIVSIPRLFTTRFENGGFKIELSYNWIFVFIPSEVSVQSLDGSIYGRGLGLVMDPGFGIEFGWAPGENRPGHLFYASLKIGISGGLSFPKMTFKLNKFKYSSFMNNNLGY